MLQVLRQLVLEMRDALGTVPQQLKSFVMEQCAGTVCLAALRNSRLDVRSPSSHCHQAYARLMYGLAKC